MVERKQIRKQSLIQLAGGVLIIILINIIGSFEFARFDLTSEKRYTLSAATKSLITNLEDVVYVRVYLDGEFPARYKRLQDATKEMLDEMRAYSDGNLEYEFINPFENEDREITNSVVQELQKQGLLLKELKEMDNDGVSKKWIVPGAIFAYQERELPLQILPSQEGSWQEEAQINNSIQTLEYEIANTIKKLSTSFQPKIAFIEGHGELDASEVEDISRSLSESYRVSRVKIDRNLKSLKDFKAIIIARPRTQFDDWDMFIIDQFIMNGGKVIWCIDAVTTSMDSLANAEMTMGIPNDFNKRNPLFHYGCRINQNLIQDAQSARIPINGAPPGAQPQWKLLPWIFFPLLTPTDVHPIGKNLELVRSEFVSTIDTVAARGVEKTFLLYSSQYSRIINAPVPIGLRAIFAFPEQSQFNKSFLPTAVLLNGKFTSPFKNHIPSFIAEDKTIGFKDTSETTEMIIIADGDIIKNQVHSTGMIYPLGYDRYEKKQFGNKDFIMNCVDYLCDESNLISVRSRELKIRMLDKAKIKEGKLEWQVANMLLPLLVILCIGVVRGFFRKRKYSR